jgi:hypothetical protein
MSEREFGKGTTIVKLGETPQSKAAEARMEM